MRLESEFGNQLLPGDPTDQKTSRDQKRDIRELGTA
uniref:Transcriptional regulator n=1 Tax=Macrostomum lignano TaxID=282301 RepID=A0A1I8FK68_9PLAT